ncbi:MAG: probable membrane protein NMA1128 [uncultured Rubrobacteraceae bacterium]|uniref:Probable membrane protein NMA1128 n=1 Tax=uncultured Rubrobacteraceae bacterium TaxID=349277 RepID=A0A6J4QUW4_9ACTN|nr:MAG: probable membrane protein NMA1128 [uncultured Rubrobacteraceae bacterium]
MAENEPILWITLAVMLVGLAGSVLPGLPGVPLIFASALVYAYATDFEVVGASVLVLLGLFALIAFVADLLATTYGARRFGASSWGTVGGAVGGLVGTLAGALLFGIGALFGLLAGTVVGVFAGEYLKRQRRSSTGEGAQPEGPRFGRADWQRVSRAAGGVLVGYLFSAAVQGILGLAGTVIFIAALFY